MILTELLTKITPLPWKLDEPNPVKISDSVYCTHAANVLPDLVGALQSIKDMLDADNEKSYRGDDPEGAMDSAFEAARAALARAELVKP